MDKNEAKNLLDYILLGRKPNVARLHELGNGEFVIILKKRAWHCWCPADWALFLEVESEKSKKKEVTV